MTAFGHYEAHRQKKRRRTEPESRPVQEAPSYMPVEERPGVPWEREGPLLVRFLATMKGVVFRSPTFFEQMRVSGGLVRPLLFALPIIWITSGLGESWPLLFVSVKDTWQYLVKAWLFWPLVNLAGFGAGVLVIHFFLILLRGNGHGLQATFRVVAYASAFEVFNPVYIVILLIICGFRSPFRVPAHDSAAAYLIVIPILFMLSVTIWGLVVVIIGICRAHFTTAWRALLSVLVPGIMLYIVFKILR
jgi:hypothetical protein